MASLAPSFPPTPPPLPALIADQQCAPQLLRLNCIEVQEGFNPRKFFNPETYRELLDSVRRHQRVLQNIIVRPQPDRPGWFWVVAGERRWRAANEAGLSNIPALILDLTDEQALELAISENQNRDNITPGEEALCAQRMMQLTHGDRDEAARRLAWSAHKLDARLLLCQATESVLMALAERKIKLGHAELLSTLPEATQDGTLASVIERQPPVEELRKKLDAFALDLGTACFDLAGCQSCPHNTTRQSSLFEQHIGAGRCTQRTCFQTKTLQHLEAKRIGLRDEYNAVFLDTERTSGTWKLLVKRDVGSQQFNEGCKQCANFGCLLSSKPGEAGQLTTDVCFDLTCHRQKVAAYQASLNPEPAIDPATPAASTSAGKPQTKSATTASTKPKSQTTAALMPKRVRELIDDTHRRGAAFEVQHNPKMIQVYALLALLHELHLMNSPDVHDPLNRRGIRRKTGDARTSLITALYALDASELNEITAELAGMVAGRSTADAVNQGENYLAGARASLKVLAVDMSKHFCLDATYLETHTKAGVESLLTEAAFDKYYNHQKNDPAAFSKLMKTKHSEIVQAVMKAGFDFKGFVPRALLTPIT